MSTDHSRNGNELVTYDTTPRPKRAPNGNEIGTYDANKEGRESPAVARVEPHVTSDNGHNPSTDWCASDPQSNPVYRTLYRAFDVYNVMLFQGQLPRPVITLRKTARYKGYFHAAQFEHRQTSADHIAMNAVHFDEAAPEQALSTLVHEMVHLWQHRFGSPSRPGYHNAQWAEKMRSIGLIPSHTGEPGGRQTGQGMSHYIEAMGPFFMATAVFLRHTPDLVLCHEKASPGRDPKKDVSKTKYTCPRCGLNAWAKPQVRLRCDECDLVLTTPPGEIP